MLELDHGVKITCVSVSSSTNPLRSKLDIVQIMIEYWLLAMWGNLYYEVDCYLRAWLNLQENHIPSDEESFNSFGIHIKTPLRWAIKQCFQLIPVLS